MFKWFKRAKLPEPSSSLSVPMPNGEPSLWSYYDNVPAGTVVVGDSEIPVFFEGIPQAEFLPSRRKHSSGDALPVLSPLEQKEQ